MREFGFNRAHHFICPGLASYEKISRASATQSRIQRSALIHVGVSGSIRRLFCSSQFSFSVS